MKRLLIPALSITLLAASAFAADPAKLARPQRDTEKKALEFLLTKQGEDGSWVPQAGPAVTAMVVRGLIQAGHSTDEPAIKKALAFIDKHNQKDGGWYIDSNATYNTSITLSTIATLPEPARAKYKDQIANAQKFLKALQSGASWAPSDDKGQTVDEKHPWYGGWGYGQGDNMKPGKRPDMSNTHFVIEALRDSGVPADDESIKRAVVFLTRNQASEANPLPWAKGLNSGGFIYSTRWNEKHQFYGESEGPDTKDRDGNEILTAYGSMTYAGLKSFIYADLKADDPRVKAAIRWISSNYTLDQNPGLNNAQGLYYYYHVFAKALDALGQDTITDAKGVKHDWRAEFETQMAKQQKPDGSFINAADRWMESNPVLVTSYVVLALQEVRGADKPSK